MKLFALVLFAFASIVKAEPTHHLRVLEKEPEFKKLGPRFLEDVTINREYNEEGQVPAGRQVQVSMEHPVDEPEGFGDGETLKKPSEDEHAESEEGHRSLYYNCYYWCWWNWYYGYITYCCPWWGCGYYYC